MKDAEQIKKDFLSQLEGAPFKTTFKVVLGYHLANTLVTLVGLAVAVGFITLVFRSLK